MTTAVRKRQQLTGMRYERVDLVPDGANEHADILIAKNRPPSPRVLRVSKAMGSVTCNKCGMKNGKGAKVCRRCGSHDLETTRVDVTKTVVNPRTKKVPKNDDAANSTSNASGYTFEDEQYDQDNGENGQALGDAVERSVMSKSLNSEGGWFPIRKDDVDDVDNEKREKQVEGEDSDDDIEELAETKPVGLRPDRRIGYADTATGANDTTGMTFKSRSGAFKAKKLRKTAVERPGLNSWDYGDQGSQEVAENAEQMYRSESQPTRAAQERRDSTLSDVLAKAGGRRRRRSNREGLDILENGNSGIYQHPGVKRNGTNTGQRKITNQGRTAVAPPGNPLDRNKMSGPVAKNSNIPLSTLEALNLGVGLAENIGLIMKANRPDLYETAVGEFLDHLNAFAGEWFGGGSVSKSKYAGKQAMEVADRVNAILRKASPEAEMSDEASEDGDADDADSKRPKVYSKKSIDAGEDESRVGKKKVFKSLSDPQDPYAGLPAVVRKKLEQFDDFQELRTQEQYLAKARTLRGLPGFNEDKVAKQLRTAYEADQEAGDYLYETLSASANAVNDSGIFKQLGMPGMGTDTADDPMGRADAWARSQVSKANDGVTVEQLRVQYMREHGADFYQPAKQLQ